MTKIIVTVVARGDELVRSDGPVGFRHASQWFFEAGLEDATGAAQSSFQKRLRILHRAFTREFGNKVALQVIDPWSLQGLWFCTRHRIRSFPCLVIAQQCMPLDLSQIEVLEIVRQALGKET